MPEVENWWDVFQDPVLTGFVEAAIENNQDLIAAHERVEQARDVAKIVRSKLFPQIDFSPAYSNQIMLTQLYGPGLPHYPFVDREHQMNYALPFTLSYELDIWGKIRSRYKSAKLTAEAREAAYKTALLIVTTDLANAYFQLRTLDAQIELYEALIETRKKVLEINQSRYSGELINFSDVTLSDQDLNNIESLYFEVRQKRNLFENVIAVLLGVTPSEFTIEHMPITDMPPVIPAGMPSEALLRRPDIAERERTMEAFHATLGVAYAAYFPEVDVVAGLGLISPLAKYFLHGLSRWWMIGTNITEVVFDAQARHYNVEFTWAQYRESVASYRQAVLNAFQDVENALSNLEWIGKQMESIDNSVRASMEDYEISSDRYTYGVVSYLPVMDKALTELENERVYIALLGLRYTNTIQLIKALGGGW